MFIHAPIVASAAFDPNSFFLNGENGGVWDGSNLSSLYQDSAGTVPVIASGNPVGRISDLSDHGVHLTQSTALARPTWNSAGYVEFDGVNHYIWNNNTCPYTTAQTWVVAFESLVTGSTRTRQFGRDGLHALNDTNNEALWYAQGVSSSVATIDRTPRSRPNVFTFRRESATVATARWNGQVRATFDPTDSSTPSSIVFGSDVNTGANKGALHLYASILINRNLTDEELVRAERWCADKIAAARFQACDIIAIAGQSNTYYGATLNSGIDVGHSDIYEFTQNGDIILADDPLDTFVGRSAGRIGFAMEFARNYVDEGYLTPGNKLLVVHCGLGGTGFSTAAPNTWSVASGSLRERTINRINAALEATPGSTFKALLWNQGESDAQAGGSWPANHLDNLTSLFSDFRSEIQGAAECPIIVGQMVPGWVSLIGTNAETIQNVLTAAETNFYRSSVALGTGLVGEGGNTQDIHYDAASQRTLGERYFTAYESLI